MPWHASTRYRMGFSGPLGKRDRGCAFFHVLTSLQLKREGKRNMATRQPISSATSTFGTVLTSTFLFDGGIIAQNNSVSKAGFSG